MVLKLLYDEFKIKVIATGSSELKQKGKEFDSQAGRFVEHYCLPLSIEEIRLNSKVLTYNQPVFERAILEKIQIFGSYPEVYVGDTLSVENKIELLENIVDTYVLKDVIDIYQLKDGKLAKDILTKIALQLGSEVSVREIASSLGSNGTTVANYIEIFIKNYILIPLPSFKTNVRKAVSENRKLYFYDLGIRNALVKDFRETNLRPDKGGLFENFIISELEKRKRLINAKVNMYFYREYGGKKVDIVLEDYKKQYKALEVKLNKGQVKNVFPLPNVSQAINSGNYFTQIVDAF